MCRFFLLATLGLAVVLRNAHHELASRHAFEAVTDRSAVVAPPGPPPLTQESIDLALRMYGIQVPSSADAPKLDLTMHDRGLTTRGAFMDKARVTIGPAAFSSWALLGSTLGHEIEVHCQQNFLAIYLLDLVGLDGTGAAERQAYVHELRNAKRFGTQAEDTQMIAETVEFYYPDDAPRSLLPKPVRSWLARALLTSGAKLNRPVF